MGRSGRRAATREPWLAVDPKPHVGDPAYDPLQHMINCDRLVTDPVGLVGRIARLLDLDPGRLRRWLFARCVIDSDQPELAAAGGHACAVAVAADLRQRSPAHYRRPVSESAAGRPTALSDAVSAGLAGTGVPVLSAGVQRLMAAYRSGEVPSAPVMATRADAASYAAYRMPATAAAVVAAVRQMRLALPGWQPASLVDFGAGTGSAAWAACAELPDLGTVTLLEQSAEATKLGRAILAQSSSPALRSATWQSWRLGTETAGGAVPAADLATVSYVLGELPSSLQADLVRLAVQSAAAVLLVEPGTPAGHARILAAREQLLASGYQLVAPCPHELSCPLAVAGDWCHFGVRLPRSAVHRQAKGAELGYEDEKFSYVAAARPPLAPERPAARVVRRPQQRKGLVMLEVCAADGASRRELIGKSKGEVYRRARKTAWGDPFE